MKVYYSNAVVYSKANCLIPDTKTWLRVGISEDLSEAILKASNRGEQREKNTPMRDWFSNKNLQST